MTDRKDRSGSGGVEDNVRDELNEAASRGNKGAEKRPPTGERSAGSTRGESGAKDNVIDDLDEASSHGRGGARKPDTPRADRPHQSAGGVEDNVRDEVDEASSHGRGKDATREAVEAEEQAGGGSGNPSGGAKDAVIDDFDAAEKRSQRH